MKRFYIFLLFIFSVITVSAQSTQKVKVLEYLGEEGKRPLAGVEVSVGNATSVISDENGECTLQFRSLKPGDKVLVRRISRSDYVLFNKKITDQWYVTEDDEALTVVMCKQQLIMYLREKYQRAAKEKLLEEYQGNEESYEYQDKLEELDEIIDKFVYIDLTEANNVEKKALERIAEGDVAGALKAYDTEDLMASYKQEKKSLEDMTNEAEMLRLKKASTVALRDKAYEQVKRHVSLLRYQGGKENIERSVKLMQNIAYADTTNYQVLLDYANYNAKMSNYNEAEKAVRYCINAPDTITRIQAYITQSIINGRRIQHAKSIDFLERISKYLKEKSVEREAPTLYLKERVGVLVQLVTSYNSLRDSVGAFTHRSELLSLSHRLYEQMKDSESKRTLVEALYYANYCHYLFGKDYLAQLDGMAEAISLQEELYKEDPVRQGAMLAFLYNARAYTYAQVDKNYFRTEQERRKALALYEEVYPKNPKAYVGYLGSEYRTLADLYIEDIPEEIDKALDLLRKSEYYTEIELRMNPEEPRSHIANLYNSYTKYYLAKNDWANCEYYVEKAIEEVRPFYEDAPKKNGAMMKRLYKIQLECLNRNAAKNKAKIQKCQALLDEIK